MLMLDTNMKEEEPLITQELPSRADVKSHHGDNNVVVTSSQAVSTKVT